MENRKGIPPSQVPHTNTRAGAHFPFSNFHFRLRFSAAGCAAPASRSSASPRAPTPVADLTAVQQGDDVILSFTLPKESVDRRPLKQPPAVEIYRDFALAPPPPAPQTPVPRRALPRIPRLLVTIPSAMVDQYDDRGHIRYVDSLKPEDFTQHPAAQAIYIVRTRASPKKRRQTRTSPRCASNPRRTPSQIFAAEVTHQGVVSQLDASAKRL